MKPSEKMVLELFLIICILVIAGFFRIAYPQLAEFKGDECRVAVNALKLARGEDFPCIGLPSSKNISMPPFFIYLIAIPYLFFNDTVIATAFVGLLNTLAVFVCYLLCRRFFDKGIAIISTLLFAFSPWAVLLSRKLWPQDVLPIFNIIFVYCLYLVLKKPKSKAILPAILILAIMPGFHLIAVTVFATFMIAIIFVLPKINWRYFILGVVLGVVIYFPYLRHEFLYESGNWIGQLGESKGVNFNVFQGSLKIVTFENIRYHMGLSSSSSFIGESILTTLRFLFFIGLVSSFIFIFKKNNRIEYLLISLWYAVPVLLFCAGGIEAHPHYFLILSPVQFIMIALGFSELWKIFCCKENNRTLILILVLIASFVRYPFFTVFFIIFIITTNIKKIKKLNMFIPCLMILVLLGIVIYEGCYISSIFKQINLYGGTTGDYWVAFKHQKEATEYIVNDAKSKYNKYGEIAYCEDNLPFIWLLDAENKYPFIVFRDDNKGKRLKYRIDIDFDRSDNFEKPLGYISHKYFGPVRVVTSYNE